MAKREQKKKYRQNIVVISDTTDKKQDFISKISGFAERISPWLPWAIALVYFIFMGFLTFRYHRVGGFWVETDFYADLVPQARKLLSGQFSPQNYGTKGPVYSLFLAGAYTVVREYFYAGLLINLFACFAFLVTLYYLISNVFNRTTAALVTIAVIFNYSFQKYTYQAGSDMLFMALCALSMYFLFMNNKTIDIVLSALFGLLAFLTRYNGAFIVAGSVIYLLIIGNSFRDRLKRCGLWIIVFICMGLPWFIPNWIVQGNPVHNDNFYSVALEFYVFEKEDFSYESWTEDLPENFTGLSDIILHDPSYFFKHMGFNVIQHFYSDIKLLIEWRLGLFVLLGILIQLIKKPEKRKLIYFSFGILYFFILTLVFYSERFSLYLLTMYLPLAVWPLTERKIISSLRKYSWVPFAVIALLATSYAYTSTEKLMYELKHPPEITIYLKKLGKMLGQVEHDTSQKVMAREPHIAHYASLNPTMFPEKLKTVGEVVTFCREHGIRYVAYTGVEYYSRPSLRILFEASETFRGLETAVENKAGVVFRITGM